MPDIVRYILKTMLVLQAMLLSLKAQSIITTVAGTGIAGFNGDNIAAISAQINDPQGILADSLGNLYISDNNNNRVRKVNSSGVITTIAGTGAPGYSGDGGSAALAQINNPQEIAIDKFGNLYFADFFNNRVRKVATSGIITTIAGNGIMGYSGDGGQATAAALDNPGCVGIDDSGNVYVADNSNTVRKINTLGIITTIAGTGIAGFSGDNGPAAAAQLKTIWSIEFDKYDNLYISDAGNYRIRNVNISGIIKTVAGTGVAGYTGDGGAAISAKINSVWGVVFDGIGNLYFSDEWNNVVRKIDTNGIITTVVGNGTAGFGGDGGPPLTAELNSPGALAIDRQGNLYIGDTGNNRVRKVTNVGNMNGVIEPKKQEFSFSIYPNPNSGSFTIDVTGKFEQLSVDVYNTLGGLVLHRENIKNITIDDLQDGVYFVKIIGNGTLIKTEKVLVTK